MTARTRFNCTRKLKIKYKYELRGNLLPGDTDSDPDGFSERSCQRSLISSIQKHEEHSAPEPDQERSQLHM